MPPSGEVVAPEYLSPEARAHWDRLAPSVVAMKTLTVVDVDAFGRYCELLARYVALKKFVWSKGAGATTYRVTDERGKLRYVAELPQASELRQVHRLLLGLEREFGLTSSARSRIQVHPSSVAPGAQTGKTPAADPASDLVAYISGGQVQRRA